MSHEPEQHTPPASQQDWSDATLDAQPVFGKRAIHSAGWVLLVILIVALLITLPPLLNVNRYQHRVAQGISDSIGRPVHFDDIHLHLLPLPGLTIQNFVVQEDPAFGSEPAMRANVVEARLRLASLWRRRVEVSHIELKAPSINLVRRADGRWNLQGVVSQAGLLQSAPTAQRGAGQEPRFPYIEATEARVNIKQGETKLPWSLVDASLALWLPEENEWRIRLNGRPLRTDTDVSDVGELQVEGSLGRGPRGVMDQPLALSAKWASTPLGETAKLLLGRDTGFRGAASAELQVSGTPAQMRVSTDLHLHNLRRAEFVPRLPMSVNAHCEADAMGVAREVRNVRCAIPTAQSAGLLDGVFRSHDEHVMSAPDVITLQAEIPSILAPATATVNVDLKEAKPEYFLNWLRVFSSRIPEGVHADGTVTMHADWNSEAAPHDWSLLAACHCTLAPALSTAKPSAALAAESEPTTENAATTGTEAAGAAPSAKAAVASPWQITVTRQTEASPEPADAITVVAGKVLPTEDDASTGSARIDSSTAVHGQVSRAGTTLQYAAATLAQYAGALLPPLADDLPSAWRDAPPPPPSVQSQRLWGQRQQWAATGLPAPVAAAHRKRHH